MASKNKGGKNVKKTANLSLKEKRLKKKGKSTPSEDPVGKL